MTPLELTPDHLQAIVPFIVVGFLAQLIDGALGMAFGVITSTLLVGVLGVPPARASASVHLVEAFTTAASGISHIVHRNVDWRLFSRLALPGMAGGIGGAYLLSSIDGAVARPFVTGYLVLAGLYLGWRAWRMRTDVPPRRAKVVAPLGAVLAKRVRPRVLLGAVSVVLVVTSVYGFASSLG